jgi:Zn-dependent protease
MKGQKAYYSFHDIPFGGTGTYSSLEPGMRFSQKEIIHILIAMVVLTLSFSFAFAPYPPLSNLNAVIGNMPLSFLAIATAFFCHEIAHKYLGQKYGYWSEFRMYPQGLLFAFILGITVGIVFAAPGAVQIFGNPSKDKMGRIAAAGPSTNLLISVIFFLLWFSSAGYLAYVSFFIAYINAFLAFFNLLPFGPMDGMKIFRWRKEVWVLLIVISIGIFVSLIL